ncbi:MAG: hypothetical protein WCL44_10715 [bacterium]
MKQASNSFSCASKRLAHLAAVLAAALPLFFTGCGGGDEPAESEPPTLAGVWDLMILDSNELFTLMLTQSGNNVTGTSSAGMSVNGTVAGNLFPFVMKMGQSELTFTTTLSDDWNNMAGTFLSNNNYAGTFTAIRRGTGEGVDMTGSWLSEDMTTKASLTMQITQDGNTLTGIPQGSQTPLAGVISGSQIAFSKQTAGNNISWSGNLSYDGNTVIGRWVNSSVPSVGVWRMTRQ